MTATFDATDFESEMYDPDEVEMIPATGERKPGHYPVDISTKAFWNQTSEQREESFAVLRREQPVSWQRPVDDAVTPDPDDPGYWAVVKHADIVRVSRDNDTFISGQGVLFDLLPPIFLELTQSFLAMDNPKHDQLRKLVASAFTPKQIKSIEDKITLAAKEIVDGFASEPSGEIDFVTRCAKLLPTRIFCDIMGIPEHLREATEKNAADIVAWADDEVLAGRQADEVQIQAATNLHDIATELIELKRAEPSDDLVTSLIDAEVDGRTLDDFEIGSFFVLMAVAGTDTTRHTASLTVRAMTHFPEQRQWLMEDYEGRIGNSIEEFIRYACPVMTFRRTAVKETELGGHTVIPGDKVVLFYPSGCMDEDVFDSPGTFDLSRANARDHTGFGGGGVHFCLGNQLAKSMLRALFRELLTRIPEFEAGEPELLGTNFMRGVKRMPFRFTPEK
ncbi:cytochrome P450 [Pseudonocardia sp. Ae150A_Ps1]|uniref:cytochrome P450 n=1 Tax=Pseudonocardia sp. Ae150A_Ps1 TaxID=1885028 RepID=UPI00095BC6C5|nr:cytochrome P450 [Pseudonocardia sp. Ae150A_Ps1]OLL74638.1 putative cytochrome P450 hydroxylase [Pseudonocardia sp. Ae150A_Ps1]